MAKTDVKGKPFKRFMGEVKVMNRLVKDIEKSDASRAFDGEGNLRSRTNFNNSDQRFRRLGNRLESIQNTLDEGKLRGQRIRSNLKGIVKLKAKTLARKLVTSHPVAAVAAQALIPSKLGDSTIHKGFKQEEFKRK